MQSEEHFCFALKTVHILWIYPRTWIISFTSQSTALFSDADKRKIPKIKQRSFWIIVRIGLRILKNQNGFKWRFFKPARNHPYNYIKRADLITLKMNFHCICHSIASNIRNIRQALSNQQGQQFCDETGCYDTGNFHEGNSDHSNFFLSNSWWSNKYKFWASIDPRWFIEFLFNTRWTFHNLYGTDDDEPWQEEDSSEWEVENPGPKQ